MKRNQTQIKANFLSLPLSKVNFRSEENDKNTTTNNNNSNDSRASGEGAFDPKLSMKRLADRRYLFARTSKYLRKKKPSVSESSSPACSLPHHATNTLSLKKHSSTINRPSFSIKTSSNTSNQESTYQTVDASQYISNSKSFDVSKEKSNAEEGVTYLKQNSLFHRDKKNSFSLSGGGGGEGGRTSGTHGSSASNRKRSRHYSAPKHKSISKSFCRENTNHLNEEDSIHSLINPNLIPSSVRESLVSIHYHLHRKPQMLQTSFISRSDSVFDKPKSVNKNSK